MVQRSVSVDGFFSAKKPPVESRGLKNPNVIRQLQAHCIMITQHFPLKTLKSTNPKIGAYG